MEKNVLIYVYGTLMNGNHNNRLLAGAEYIGDASTKGLIYDMPVGFPAMCLGNNECVGEVWRVSELMLEHLDMLEGYNERDDDGMYLRRETRAWMESGQEVEVSYYLWNRELPRGSGAIPSGVKWHRRNSWIDKY